MIQGIDGNTLLNAFRAGKQDRYADQDREIKMREMEAAAAREKQVSGLMGQVFGGSAPTTGGVAGAYPQSTPPMPGVISGYGGGTFNMDGTQATPTAPNMPTLSPEESGASPMAQAPERPQRGGVNYDALAQLSVIDPETGGKIASALKTMNEVQIKQMDAKNMAMATASHYLSKLPQGQRGQVMSQVIAQHLMQAGWSPEELQRADLSDRGLQFYQAQGMDMDKLLSAELAERKFQAGDNVSIQPGGAVINVKPDGTGSYVVKPFQMGDSGGDNVPSAAADYLRQHPELKGAFDQKYGAGAADAILGGGAGNGAGGFPGQ